MKSAKGLSSRAGGFSFLALAGFSPSAALGGLAAFSLATAGAASGVWGAVSSGMVSLRRKTRKPIVLGSVEECISGFDFDRFFPLRKNFHFLPELDTQSSLSNTDAFTSLEWKGKRWLR
jgi:hypothetical protein